MNLNEVRDNLPSGYKLWLSALKQSNRNTQLRAVIKANSELIHLYLRLGADTNYSFKHKQ